MFRELEFNSLIREFGDAATLFETSSDGATVSKVEQKYSIIDNREDLDKLIRKLWETEHWSFEVDDSNGDERLSCFHKVPPAGVAIALAPGVSHYIDLDNFKEGRDAAIGPLRDILANGFLDTLVG